MIDAAGHTTTYGYDAAGHMTSHDRRRRRRRSSGTYDDARPADPPGEPHRSAADQLRRLDVRRRGPHGHPGRQRRHHHLHVRRHRQQAHRVGRDAHHHRHLRPAQPGRSPSTTRTRARRPTPTYTYSLTSPSWTDPTGTYTATLDAFDRPTVARRPGQRRQLHLDLPCRRADPSAKGIPTATPRPLGTTPSGGDPPDHDRRRPGQPRPHTPGLSTARIDPVRGLDHHR